jgi:hypothetical protein
MDTTDTEDSDLGLVEIYYHSAMHRHWIGKTREGQYYKFPAKTEGWKYREPFEGASNALNPVSDLTARQVATTTGAPLNMVDDIFFEYPT